MAKNEGKTRTKKQGTSENAKSKEVKKRKEKGGSGRWKLRRSGSSTTLHAKFHDTLGRENREINSLRASAGWLFSETHLIRLTFFQRKTKGQQLKGKIVS